jgi:hypothetical protein
MNEVQTVEQRLTALEQEHEEFRKVHVSRRGVEGPRGEKADTGASGRDGDQAVTLRMFRSLDPQARTVRTEHRASVANAVKRANPEKKATPEQQVLKVLEASRVWTASKGSAEKKAKRATRDERARKATRDERARKATRENAVSVALIPQCRVRKVLEVQPPTSALWKSAHADCGRKTFRQHCAAI